MKGIKSCFDMVKKRNLQSTNLQTLFNIISMIIKGGISYLTMPIFTRILGAEQYGMYSIYLSWSGIFACFMGLQCGSSLAARYYKYNDYKEYKAGLFSFCLMSSFIIIAVAIFFIEPIEGITELHKPIVVMMLFDAMATFVLAYANNGWVYEKKAQKNMLVAAMNALLGVGVSIVLIYFWTSDNLYIARVTGNFLPALLIAVVICIEIFKEGGFQIDSAYVTYGLHFGIPVLFHTLSQYILAQSDRLMMLKMGINKKDIGIYSFAYGFSMVLLTILLALGNGWTPFLYEGLKEKKYCEVNQSVTDYTQLFTVLCCGFLLVSKEFGELFGGAEFSSGLKLIPIFTLAIYSIFIYQFAVNYEFFMEQPKYVALMTIISAVINLVLNWFMIPEMGICGAALATLISYICLVVLHFAVVYLWKHEKYPLKVGIVIMGTVVVGITAVLFFVLYDYWIIRWPAAFLLGTYLIVKIIRQRSIF